MQYQAEIARSRHVRVAIAGSGFGGLGAAIRLRQEGEEDIVVFERGSDVGGVWRDNTYPGCACDVESHLYSFSFAPNPDWTHRFSRWEEIQKYLRACAHRFGVLDKIRFHREVLRAEWNDEGQHWRIETTGGAYTADVFVAATGALSEPSTPNIAGIERFRGKAFHSARWDHGYDLAGKCVAVIGTGASAIQFVPEIRKAAAKVSLFQRTAPWVLPRRDRRISEESRARLRGSRVRQWIARNRIYALREVLGTAFFHPGLARQLEKLALAWLKSQVADPVLRAKLTPNYTIGCKRILISDDYLRAVTHPNVDVVTTGIREITENAVVTDDGTVHEVDALIFGTGFKVQEYPFSQRVFGRDGRSAAQTWADAGGMSAHLGTTIPGFPNAFVIQGPNTGLGHTSVILMIEAQIEHIVNAVRFMRNHGWGSVEPKPEAQEAWLSEVDRKMQSTVWKQGGCASWYLDAKGRNSTLWPGYTFTFVRRVAPFDAREYVLVRARASVRLPRVARSPMESAHA